MNRVVFLREAEEEMLAATRFYNAEAPGLGIEYLNETESVENAFLAHPHAAPIIQCGIRRRLLQRFPFGILYRIDDEEIVIVAVSLLVSGQLRTKKGN